MNPSTASKKVVYKDSVIKMTGCLLSSYLIDSLGRPESFFERILSAAFYIDLGGGFFMSLVVWEVVRRVVIGLDRRFGWFSQTLVRLIAQAFFGVVLPALLSFFLTYVYMKLVWRQDIFQTEWLYNEFFFVILLIVFVNFFYFTYWLYKQGKPAPNNTSTQQNNGVESIDEPPGTTLVKKRDTIEVTKGGKLLLLPTSALAYAYLKDGYCYLKKFDAETFVTTYALDDLFELLDETGFFRANRQVIISRAACKAYGSIENGKIEIEAEPTLKEKIIVSQKRAKAFRQWISMEMKYNQV